MYPQAYILHGPPYWPDNWVYTPTYILHGRPWAGYKLVYVALHCFFGPPLIEYYGINKKYEQVTDTPLLASTGVTDVINNSHL